MSFQTDVIEKSHQKPVLVDFWAPWCGPCRVLGPVLEQLAGEQKERWELVKINTEEEEELAYQYNIRSIPNVKLFFKGEVIDEFTGALPKTSIERWLDKALPNPALEELQAIVENNALDPALKVELLRSFLKRNPDIQEAQLALAQFLVYSNPAEAETLLKNFRMGHPQYETVQDLLSLSELMQLQEDVSTDQVHAQLIEAQKFLLNSAWENAIQAVIEATRINKAYQNDLPRRSGIALFRLWGSGHELTRKYRRRFDMVLY